MFGRGAAVAFAATWLLLQPAAALAQSNDPEAVRQWVDRQLEQEKPGLVALYKDIHAHPEVAFQETRTAGILAERMKALGFDVTTGVGGTGVVAVLKNGDGPTAMVRTELDGLPLTEKTGLPYASTYRQDIDGKATDTMHGCGHDMHMAWWLGAAEVLAANRAAWKGTLVFVAQPAEEVLGGARAMLDDGLFTRFPKPDFAFGAHTNNGPAGSVTVKDGTVAAASDAWEIVFHGRGGHGSMPSQTIDPIVEAARFVTDVQTVVSRERPEREFGVISIGSLQAGTVANIIPDSATVRLTLRAFSPEVRKLLNDGTLRTAKAVAEMAGAPEPSFKHLNGGGPLANDSKLVARVMQMFRPALGDELTFVPSYEPGTPPSEDFAEYVGPETGVQGVFFNVGVYSPAVLAELARRKEPVPANHSPFFAPDPDLSMVPGARALTLAVLSVL